MAPDQRSGLNTPVRYCRHSVRRRWGALH